MRLPTPHIADVHLNADDERHTRFTRRRLISGAAALAGFAVLDNCTNVLAQTTIGKRPVTPSQTAGPFYPISLPADQDADMTVLGNNKARAQGTVIYVSGRVLDINGAPIANATLDIWQANAAGRYAHPADSSKAPLDANFQGFARIRSSADGSYRFKSIKPGAYPTGDGLWTRPPHIHFDVRGAKSRIVTQMYFEGDPWNAKDHILNGIKEKQTVIAKLDAADNASEKGDGAEGGEKGALNVRWDVVLAAG